MEPSHYCWRIGTVFAFEEYLLRAWKQNDDALNSSSDFVLI
jgi:hypothetical protein